MEERLGVTAAVAKGEEVTKETPAKAARSFQEPSPAR